jgi:uncharacterized protein YxeA
MKKILISAIIIWLLVLVAAAHADQYNDQYDDLQYKQEQAEARRAGQETLMIDQQADAEYRMEKMQRDTDDQLHDLKMNQYMQDGE